MAELYPLPLGVQLQRIFSQYKAEGAIYDLPQRSFYRPDAVALTFSQQTSYGYNHCDSLEYG